jgi:phosphoglycerate dehydrogenase-like enzyme
VSPEDFGRLPRLRWIHSWAAGPNAALFDELVASPVVLTSSAGNGGVPLAEHAMMLLLMADRDASRWSTAQREHRWDRHRHPELMGTTIGIYGLGNAGKDLAHKAKAFHMRVLGLRRKVDVPVDDVDELYGPAQLKDFVRDCDHVVITAPLTPQTRHAFDASVFAAMKPTATLVCISRGGIVVDEDLVEALRNGEIRAAGLDAHGIEPLPADSPFWDLPNVIVTPHNGATTPGTLQRQVEIFLDNLARFADGRELRNVVDKVLGY